MTSTHDDQGTTRTTRVRKWAVRCGVALLAFEVFYVIAGNIFIRTDLLLNLINKKPEKTSVSWTSAMTYLPGFAKVEGFTLTSQTLRNQVYVHVDKADARISLVKLLFKTIHIRGVDAAGVDVRYRPRLDRPPKVGHEDEPVKELHNVEFWPEIPGLTNPPDPKPEDLYPKKKKKRPWTIKITGADVAGPISVALKELRVEGEGSVGGGVTVIPRKTVTIHRGKLGLSSATVVFGAETLAEGLVIDADLKIDAFPAKGAKAPDVLAGVTGEFSVSGTFSEKAAVAHEITPGISTLGSGRIKAHFVLKRGLLRKGSEYSLESDAFRVRVMDLEATGSASVSGGTVKEKGSHVTRARVELGDFELVNPDNEKVGVTGSGIELDAEWDGFSLASRVPASHAEIVLPRAQIQDVSIFNALLPSTTLLAFQSGTGEVEAKLDIEDSVAAGNLDLVADDIVLETRGTALYGDFEVHANLAQGDLVSRKFDLSGTTLHLDDIIDRDQNGEEVEKREAWFCKVDLVHGEVTVGKPLSADGRVEVKMFDTRPVVALMKELDTGPKWMSLLPVIKDVGGEADVVVGKGHLAFSDLDFSGKGFQALGWVQIRDKKADGRLYVKYKALGAGISLDQGKAKVHISKPKKWFDAQPTGPGS